MLLMALKIVLMYWLGDFESFLCRNLLKHNLKKNASNVNLHHQFPILRKIYQKKSKKIEMSHFL